MQPTSSQPQPTARTQASRQQGMRCNKTLTRCSKSVCKLRDELSLVGWRLGAMSYEYSNRTCLHTGQGQKGRETTSGASPDPVAPD
jgi:hypothetical protein